MFQRVCSGIIIIKNISLENVLRSVSISYKLILALFLLTKATKTEDNSVFVNKGHSITFECNHNQTSLSYLSWSYISYKSERQVYLYDFRSDGATKNYQASCRYNQTFCNLTLVNAIHESAGTYFCKVIDEKENIEITVTKLHLIVGSLICKSNIKPNSLIIGENDCKERFTDELERTCLLVYNGKLDETPNLGWIRKYKNGNQINESFQAGKLNKSNLYFINDRIIVSSDFNEIKIECFAKHPTGVVPCALPALNIIHIKSVFSNATPSKDYIPHEVTCRVNKSRKINCSCTWSHNLGMAQTQIHGCNLPEINRKQPGIYTCNVKCHLSTTKECNMEAMQFAVLNSPQDSFVLISSVVDLESLKIFFIAQMALTSVGIFLFVLNGLYAICFRRCFTVPGFCQRLNKPIQKAGTTRQQNINSINESDSKDIEILIKRNGSDNSKHDKTAC